MRPMLRASHLIITVLLVLPSLLIADTLVVKPIAVSRQTAPVGGRYILFGSASIDNARRVTFTASLSRGQVGIFRSQRGSVTPLVLTGDDAPDDAGTRFEVPIEAASNTRGDMAFIASVFFPVRQGVFLMRDGVITTLALEGAPAPTRRGEFFAGFGQIRILDSGDVYFSAALTDAPFSTVEAGQAIVRSSAGRLEALIAPGDDFMGEREIFETLQYHVNESGEIATLARIVSADLLQPTTVTEMLLYSGGRLMTLASDDLVISDDHDLVRNFAITFDQVKITSAGAATFFAATNDFMNGGYFINRTGLLLDNERLLAQGDRTMLSGSDRFAQFGGFGISGSEDLVFHGFSALAPAGGIFYRRGGGILPVALAGETRPDGTDVYHGFLLVEMNEAGAFVFTDFQDQFVQVGVFAGRLLPDPPVIVRQILDLLGSTGLPRMTALGLLGEVRSIGRDLDRGDTAAALRLAQALRIEVARRAGRSIPQAIALQLDLELEDLIDALGGPTRTLPGRPNGSRLVVE